MADWVRRGGALPPIDELRGELVEPIYTFNNGKLQLEAGSRPSRRGITGRAWLARASV